MKDLVKLARQMNQPKTKIDNNKTFTDEEIAYILDTRNTYADVAVKLRISKKTIAKRRKEHSSTLLT